MESAIIVQQLRSFIVENFLFGEEGSLKDADSFLETGILDSTGVLQLVGFLEENYGITFEEEELTPENLDSINNIIAYLNRKMGRKQEEGNISARGVATLGGNK
jgi:acyl carrier protein